MSKSDDTPELLALKAEASGELERMATAPVVLCVDASTLMLLSALCSSALAGEPAPAELAPAARQFLDALSAKLLGLGFPAISEVMWALIGYEDGQIANPPSLPTPLPTIRPVAEITDRCQHLARLLSALRAEGQLESMSQPKATLAALRWVLVPTLTPLQSGIAALSYIHECEER